MSVHTSHGPNVIAANAEGVGSQTRQAAPSTPRGHAARERREAVRARSEGHCAYPCCTETEGLERDHVIPLGLGGKDDASNEQMLCKVHHKQKTALDIKLIAKAKRRRIKNGLEPRKAKPTRQIPSRKLEGRGFSKHPTHKRDFSGQVVPR